MHGPWLVNVVASVVSMLCLIGFLLIWHPKKIWRFEGEKEESARGERTPLRAGEIARAWVPWVMLSVIVFLWGTQTGKIWMNTPEKAFASLATMSPKAKRNHEPAVSGERAQQPGGTRPARWCRKLPRKARSSALTG